MTKYYQDRHKFDRNDDTPIAVRDYTNTSSDHTYYCSWCQRQLVKLRGRSGENITYYCNFCSIESNPEEKELRSKSRIEPHEGTNKTPLASTKFTEPTLGKKKVEIEGALAELQKRSSIKIKTHTESKG
jgi:hypothetical protein